MSIAPTPLQKFLSLDDSLFGISARCMPIPTRNVNPDKKEGCRRVHPAASDPAQVGIVGVTRGEGGPVGGGGTVTRGTGGGATDTVAGIKIMSAMRVPENV